MKPNRVTLFFYHIVLSYGINKLKQIISFHIISYNSAYRIGGMERHESHEQYAHRIYLSIPESVVSNGIALAISAMAFPSSCICDAVGADVGIDVGADVGTNVGDTVGINVGAEVEEDIVHYSIVSNNQNGHDYRISAFIR